MRLSPHSVCREAPCCTLGAEEHCEASERCSTTQTNCSLSGLVLEQQNAAQCHCGYLQNIFVFVLFAVALLGQAAVIAPEAPRAGVLIRPNQPKQTITRGRHLRSTHQFTNSVFKKYIFQCKQFFI